MSLLTVTIMTHAADATADADAPAGADAPAPDLERMRAQIRDMTQIDPAVLSPRLLPLAYESVELWHALDAARWAAWCDWEPNP